METTLAGSHSGRTFALEVSGKTWDRFRDWRNRHGKKMTTGALLCFIADSRPDPTATLSESEVILYLDAMEKVARAWPVAPDTV